MPPYETYEPLMFSYRREDDFIARRRRSGVIDLKLPCQVCGTPLVIRGDRFVQGCYRYGCAKCHTLHFNRFTLVIGEDDLPLSGPEATEEIYRPSLQEIEALTHHQLLA